MRTQDPPAFSSALEAAKAQSWAQLLFKCARLLNDKALTQIRRETGRTVRPAHTALFPHIDLDGTRPSLLAQKLGISKQAVGQLVQDLEAMGMVERIADPTDARATLIRFSAAGRKGLLSGLQLLGRVEADLATQVGAKDIAHMHTTLARLLGVLEAPKPLVKHAVQKTSKATATGVPPQRKAKRGAP